MTPKSTQSSRPAARTAAPYDTIELAYQSEKEVQFPAHGSEGGKVCDDGTRWDAMRSQGSETVGHR